MAHPQARPKPLRGEHAQPRPPYLISSGDGPSTEAEQHGTAASPEFHAGPPLLGRWRATGIIAGFAVAAVGAAAVLVYFAGALVGGIMIAALSALVAWGNWILDNTIEL